VTPTRGRDSREPEHEAEPEERTSFGRQPREERVREEDEACGEGEHAEHTPPEEDEHRERGRCGETGERDEGDLGIDVVVAPRPRLAPRRKAALAVAVLAVQACTEEPGSDGDERRPEPEAEREAVRDITR
jgi:hypothetical protein